MAVYVKLTAEEIEKRAQELARLEIEYEAAKKDAAEDAKETRDTLKGFRDRIVTLSREIRAGEVAEDPQLEIGSGPDEPIPADDEQHDPGDDGDGIGEPEPDDDDF